MSLLKDLENNKITLEEIDSVKKVLLDYIKTTKDIENRSKTLNKLHDVAMELEKEHNGDGSEKCISLKNAKEKFDKDLEKEKVISNHLSSFILKMQF